MAKLVNSISFFFPVYNVESCFEKFATDTLRVLKEVASKYEMILVEDGSSDGSKSVVEKLVKKYGKQGVRAVYHVKNIGYGAALTDGFYAAKYEWIGVVDSDAQFDTKELSLLLQKAKEGYDGVTGYRINRRDPPIRKLFGATWTFLNNLLFGLNIRDVDCGFKLVKKEVIDKISRLESQRGAMISPELWAKAKKAGFTIGEVGVHHYPRDNEKKQTGASVIVIVKSFFDLLRLWWKLQNSN